MLCVLRASYTERSAAVDAAEGMNAASMKGPTPSLQGHLRPRWVGVGHNE